MRLVNKLFSVIALIISLAVIAFADSNGIVINWQPFVAKDSLELNLPLKNTLPKNLFSPEEKWRQSDDSEDLLHIDLKTINSSQNVATKKSAFGKIKISVSQVDSFMLSNDENYSSSKDGNLSQAASILPSLLRNPSQEKTLETLKLIQPQVNFGFEF